MARPAMYWLEPLYAIHAYKCIDSRKSIDWRTRQKKELVKKKKGKQISCSVRLV